MRPARRPDAPSRSIEVYLADIGRVPLLSAEEEQELARAYRRDRDRRAADRLVAANLRFVVKVAFEYRRPGLSLPDLIQEGNIGLLRAVERFDPDRNVRLISYAVSSIRACMRDHLLRSHSLVKLGTTRAQRKLFFSLAGARRDLEHPRVKRSAGELDTSTLLARALDVKAVEVDEMSLRMEGPDLSLDAIVAEGLAPLVDRLADPRPGHDDVLGEAQEQRRLQTTVGRALARLDRRERYVVERRAMSDEGASLVDLAEHFRVSAEWTRQLELRATRKLRRALAPLAQTRPRERDRRRSRPASAPLRRVAGGGEFEVTTGERRLRESNQAALTLTAPRRAPARRAPS
jgi:RNA polymerase sigma-32 factor